MMHAYGKRKALCLKKKIIIASAVTVSCVSVFMLYHALSRSRGIMADLLREVCGTIRLNAEESGDDCDAEYGDTVYEEDTGDSYDI